MPSEDAAADHYAALQVPAASQASEIKSAYRKLGKCPSVLSHIHPSSHYHAANGIHVALLYHPDRNHGNEAEANRKFQAIQAAYEVLNDTTRRAKYDRQRLVAGYGTMPPAPAPAAAASVPRSGFSTPRATAQSNTAKRYTAAAAEYASPSMKSDQRAGDFQAWASYNKAKPSGASDEERKRREKENELEMLERERQDRIRDQMREAEKAEKARQNRANAEYMQGESPHPIPRRPHSTKEQPYAYNQQSAYQQYHSHGRSRSGGDDARSRGRSPDMMSSARSSVGHNDSDPDSNAFLHGRKWESQRRPYSFRSGEKYSTAVRPNSPIMETRASETRYSRSHDTASQYNRSPDRERYAGRYANRHESSDPPRKDRSEEKDRQNVRPPSPPPERERSRSYSFLESEEDGNAGRKSPNRTPRKKASSQSRAWPHHAYAESEEEESEGVQADDELNFAERKFAEMNMKGKNIPSKKPKSGSWESLKGNKTSAREVPGASAPETPRRTPSPQVYSATPPKKAPPPPPPPQESEKKKHNMNMPPPPSQASQQQTQAQPGVTTPGVFA